MGLRPLKRYTTVVDAQKVAQRWYQQAVHDLEMARRNLTVEGYDVAAFLAHQAVEKLLEAAFASRADLSRAPITWTRWRPNWGYPTNCKMPSSI